MTETIRYALIGAQDVKFGLGTFEVTLADGRTVVFSEINSTHIPSPSGGVVEDFLEDLAAATTAEATDVLENQIFS